MSNFSFKGNWLVNYDPNQAEYPDILMKLAAIQEHFGKTGKKSASINVIFNEKGQNNHYYEENGTLFLKFSNIDEEFIEKREKTWETVVFKPLEKPIKSISLLFPKIESDRRWKTIGITSGQLLLASALSAAGFDVSPGLIPLPARNRPSEAFSADMTGFSLYEDLLPLLRPFLAEFRASHGGILAAGGPFPTLAPLPAIYHLPQVNLFVRGEAELTLPMILTALNKGNAEAFFAQKGVFWQQPGLIAMAGFDQVNRPDDLSPLAVDLGFLRQEHMEHGLEMNFSRGCARGCTFCCHVQGTKLRKLPAPKAGEILREYKKKVEALIEASGSPRPLLGPPPLPKGGTRGDSDPAETRSNTPLQSNSGSPRLPAPPLIRGANGDNAKNEFFPSSPPLPKGGTRGDQDIEQCSSIFTLNINDDDILQDPAYAREIFSLIKQQGFRIFGVQTSTASLVAGDGTPRSEVLDLVADHGLYVEERPLLWLGTDAFLPARAKRLGKKLPPAGKFRDLLEELERRKLRHFHYWISSDGETTWEEFAEEFGLILGFCRDFPGFGLLAHAPFTIPYPSSRMFARIDPSDRRLKLKLDLDAGDARFNYKIVERMETRWPQLNALLRNEKAGGEKGFFDFLKGKDLLSAAQLAYHFLKQEILLNPEMNQSLFHAKNELEKTIEHLVI